MDVAYAMLGLKEGLPLDTKVSINIPNLFEIMRSIRTSPHPFVDVNFRGVEVTLYGKEQGGSPGKAAPESPRPALMASGEVTQPGQAGGDSPGSPTPYTKQLKAFLDSLDLKQEAFDSDSDSDCGLPPFKF